MLHTIIEKNSYHDSIVLMLLTNHLENIENVTSISVMMGTPANKDIFKTGGLYTEELEQATPNDMVIVADVEDAAKVEELVEEAKHYLDEQGKKNTSGSSEEHVKTWDKALEVSADASVAIISVPGVHAVSEIERALTAEKHVFCFSDNVPIEDERRLKDLAHEKGLLLMGPDCGTGIINGLPIAFANVVRKGEIGVVGASGTGIQEVTTLIHKLGGGVTQAIGTGGRDLKAEVSGITFKDSLAILEQDSEVKVIVAISKPPAKEVRDDVLALLRATEKPVVAIFLGEKPTAHEKGLYRAHTLEETAQIAIELVNNHPVENIETVIDIPKIDLTSEQKYIKGYYSGGTLAYEAAMLINETLNLQVKSGTEGFILKQDKYEVIDLGDDIYTQGKPHPMIDASKRKELMIEAGKDPETAAIILDIVLGYGSHSNMASELAPSIKKVIADAKGDNREIAVIATIVGTEEDPQDLFQQKKILKEAGVIICQSNAQAVKMALALIGKPVYETPKPIYDKQETTVEVPSVANTLKNLVHTDTFLNIGLSSFTKAILDHGGKVTQFDWRPLAGGDVMLQKALDFLSKVSLKVEG